jgi:hypothetical protein
MHLTALKERICALFRDFSGATISSILGDFFGGFPGGLMGISRPSFV